MFTSPSTNTITLQPPGAGIPKFELLVARFLFAWKMRSTSQARALDELSKLGDDIIQLASNFEPPLASRQVLIDRLRGLEDSSRYWSLYMTVEHLRIVNKVTLEVINSLVRGEKLHITLSTASVKPAPGIDESVLKEFRLGCKALAQTDVPDGDTGSALTMAHPWFGELNARQWQIFAGFHMALHKKQMLRIAEVLHAS